MSESAEVEAAETIPIVEEELHVDKAEVTTQTVRVRIAVHEDEHVIDEPLRHRHVEVKRVPVNLVTDQPVAERREGDTLIIPVYREIITIQKSYQVIEEIHVRTTYQEEAYHEVVRTKRAEATIETD